jgi:hypothetical protein
MIVFTSIAANYIPKARVLAVSLKRHNPGIFFVVCLVERTIHPAAQAAEVFDLVLTAQDLGIEEFESFIFQYSLVEAATAVKGHIFKELWRRFPGEDEFVYLDPDILVLGSFSELAQSLQTHNIILTPHLCEPEENLETVWDNEVCALKHGVFNLGFLALRRSEEAEGFLEWWCRRLAQLCYADTAAGLFVDQRWMDLAPCFFEVFIFKHPGYNVAPWNLSRRPITEDAGGELRAGDYPLRFFHFSGLDSGVFGGMVSKYCPDKENPVYKIIELYKEQCARYGQKELGKIPWSYNFYSNGEKIEDEHRLFYRTHREIKARFKGPFQAETPASFYQYIKAFAESDEAFRGNHSFGARIKELYGRTKEAYDTGGARLVMTKTLKFISRKF